MKVFVSLFLGMVVVGGLFADPLKAEKKNEWATVHSKTAKNLKGKTVPVLFLGDSITHGWQWSASNPHNPGGLEILKRDFQEFNPVNFAISGDRIEHILWRITEGEQLDNFKIKVVVVMVGVNNLIRNESPASVAEGIMNLNKTILKKQPDAKILLLGVLPYSWDRNNNVSKVNSIIKNSADGKQIFFFDINSDFKDAAGKTCNLRDGIHPTPEGYRIMASRITPELRKLLK